MWRNSGLNHFRARDLIRAERKMAKLMGKNLEEILMEITYNSYAAEPLVALEAIRLIHEIVSSANLKSDDFVVCGSNR